MDWARISRNENVRIAFCLAVSVAATLLAWHRGEFVMADSYQYMHSGVSLFAGRGYVDLGGAPETFFPPLYPLAIGLLNQLTRDPILAGSLISAVSSTVSVYLVYLLLRFLFSPGISFLATLLFAGFTLRVWLSQWILSESFNLLLLLIAFVGYFVLSTRHWVIRAFLAGLFIGLAFLTRPEGIAYVGVFGLYEVLLNRSQPWRGRVVRSLTVGAVFLIVAAPYLWILHEQTGRWTVSGKTDWASAVSEARYRGVSQMQLRQLNPEATGGQLPSASWEFTVALERYLAHGRTEVERLLYVLGPTGIVPVLLLIGIGFALRGASRLRSPRTLGLQLLLMVPLLTLPVYGVEERYLLPVAPVLLAWIAKGIVGVYEWGEMLSHFSLPWHVVPRAVAVILTGALFFSHAYRQVTMPLGASPVALEQEVGYWMRDNLPTGRTMAQEPAVPFFSGMLYEPTVYADLERTLTYAVGRDVRYLLVSNRDFATPAVESIRGVSDSTKGLQLLKNWTEGNYSMWLYEVRAPGRHA